MKKSKLQEKTEDIKSTAKSNKRLIIKLIREELKNKYLMYSLEKLGFDCSFYIVNISDIVLELTGCKKKYEHLHKIYHNHMEKILNKADFKNIDKILDKYPEFLYKILIK
jgi:hypothetical protein